MKKYLWLAAVIMSAAACDEENENPNDDGLPHVNVLTKLSNGEIPTSYTYDGNFRLIGIVQQGGTGNTVYYPPYTSEITYNALGKIDSETYTIPGAGGTSSQAVMHYFYNSDTSVSSKKYYTIDPDSGDETLVTTSEFTYSGNDVTLIKHQESPASDSKVIYTMLNGNVVQLRNYTIDVDHPAGELQSTVTYSEFDDKINAQASLPAEYNFPLNFKNNYAKASDGSGNSTYTFQYNADNYPVKKTASGLFSTTFDYSRIAKLQ